MPTRQDTIDQMLAAIANMEMGLAGIIHAEADKIKVALEQRNPSTGLADMEDLLTVNKSVESMMRKVIMKEMLLNFQLEDVVELDKKGDDPEPTEIMVQPAIAEIAIAERRRLEAIVNPSGAFVIWESRHPSIATVAQNGDVDGVGIGIAEIVARTMNGLEAISNITVIDNEIEPELS
ncbi:MAG: Ig-like domain-containing protein [Defluviitaleaceae bacterium]|nr:Ig-like domain-containing protein [Defluviitaleaceae bacterium]